MMRLIVAIMAAMLASAACAKNVTHPLTVAEMENHDELSGVDRLVITGRLSFVNQNCGMVTLTQNGDALRMWYVGKVTEQDPATAGIATGAMQTLHDLAETEGMPDFCKRLISMPSIAAYIGKTGDDAVRSELGRFLAIIEFGANDCKLTKSAEAIEMEYASKFNDLPDSENAEIQESKRANLIKFAAQFPVAKSDRDMFCLALPIQQPLLFKAQ